MDSPITWDQLNGLMGEMEAMATRLLAVEGTPSTLEPGHVVSEALLRLKPAGRDTNEVNWATREEFFGALHEAMCRALVDQARRAEAGGMPHGVFQGNDSRPNNRASVAPDQVGALTPELREWARQLSTEAEIVSGLAEIRNTGGAELREFVEELEQVVHDGERTQR